LEERKLNQKGIKMMTKLKQDKQEKNFLILKDTYLNVVKGRRIKFHKYENNFQPKKNPLSTLNLKCE